MWRPLRLLSFYVARTFQTRRNILNPPERSKTERTFRNCRNIRGTFPLLFLCRPPPTVVSVRTLQSSFFSTPQSAPRMQASPNRGACEQQQHREEQKPMQKPPSTKTHSSRAQQQKALPYHAHTSSIVLYAVVARRRARTTTASAASASAPAPLASTVRCCSP